MKRLGQLVRNVDFTDCLLVRVSLVTATYDEILRYAQDTLLAGRN
jgi:hypothetical protein